MVVHLKLDRDLEQWLQRLVDSGACASVEDCVLDVLRRAIDQERTETIERTRRAVQDGLNDLENGNFVDYHEGDLVELARRVKDEQALPGGGRRRT